MPNIQNLFINEIEVNPRTLGTLSQPYMSTSGNDSYSDDEPSTSPRFGSSRSRDDEEKSR